MNFMSAQQNWGWTAIPLQPAQPAGLALSFEHVDKSFGARAVLEDLNLSIEGGEFVAIIGRSGCGKTTLLRLAAGLTEASAGEIHIGDEKVNGLNPHVKLLFQEARLLPWQTVVQNVGLARGESWRENALKALERVGLQGREDDWPATLSGGQKQRVALARALVSRPNILLLDEPFGALDALTRLEMHGLLIEAWQRDGFTTLLITHDVAEAVALADRVIVLQDGKVTLDQAVDLPRPRRALGDAAAATLQAKILGHLI